MDFICQDIDTFKNPNNLPLNELQLLTKVCRKTKKLPKDKDIEKLKDSLDKYYDVRTEKIPALDPFWIQKERSYTKYQPYFSEVSKEENDLFLQTNRSYLENLKFLLQCSYHQFWNYVVYEPRVEEMLTSFLANPVQWYEIKHLEGEFLELYDRIYEKVARIHSRLLTFKESDKEFMSESVVLHLLEENQIITYTKVLSLCSLYCKTNYRLVNSVMRLFFSNKYKSKYAKEVARILDHSLMVFEMIGGQICGFEENSVIIPLTIRSKPAKFDPYWVEEVALYLLDTASTLNAFFSNCKPALEMAMKIGLPYRLTYFYNKVYPALYDMLKNRSNLPYDWDKLKERIYDHIGIGRSEYVNTFHVFVTYLIDNIIQSLGENEKQDEYMEQYLELITSALEDEFFIFDYQNAHRIEIQLQTLSDFHPQLDRTRTNYIIECLSTLPTLENLLAKKDQVEKQSVEEFLPSASTSKSSIEVQATESKHEPSPAEIDEMIQSVLDTLPHLGDGFILQCLEAYNYDTVEVISAILDENLPPHIMDVPRNLIRIPPEPQPEKPILAYRGKKPDYKDASALLDDKSELVKDFVLKVSNVSYDMYDDEYDDRYDDEPVLHFYDRNDEASLYKHMENRFEGYELVSDPSESSSDEEDKPEDTARPRNAFCEDPALVRARREAQRKQNTKKKNFDLVGKPKGQGQDKNVTQNRDKKTVNKSSKGNHNRKSGAQWKKNKGMIPI